MVMVRHVLVAVLLGLPGLCGAQKAPAGKPPVKSAVVVARAPDTVKPAPVPVPKPVIALGGQPSGQVVERRGFDFWVLLPIVLVIGGGLLLWRRMDAMKEELRSRKREIRSITDNYAKGGGSGLRPVGLDRKELEKALGDSKVLMELTAAVSKLQQQVSQLEGRKVKMAEPLRGKPMIAAAAPPALVVPDVFYMAGPVNNYFPNSAKSLTKDNTVYRFKLSANQQEAEYELHTQGAPIMEIVQLAESYIKAACDEENLPGNPVKSILTKHPGQAVLEGDKWVIKRKALIRYE
jgi:hypothetical protein